MTEITKIRRVQVVPNQADRQTDRQGDRQELVVNALRDLLQLAQERAEKALQKIDNSKQGSFDAAYKAGIESAKLDAAHYLLAAEIARKKILRDTEERALRLILKIAEDVIGEALKSQPESILSRISRAATYLQNECPTILAINPVDYERVNSGIRQIQDNFPAEKLLRVEANPNIPESCARLEAGGMVVEASVETHFTAVKNTLLQIQKELSQVELEHEAPALASTIQGRTETACASANVTQQKALLRPAPAQSEHQRNNIF